MFNSEANIRRHKGMHGITRLVVSIAKKELYLPCLELDIQDEHLYVNSNGLKKDF